MMEVQGIRLFFFSFFFLYFPLLDLVCERIYMKTHTVESRCVIRRTAKHTLLGRVYVYIMHFSTRIFHRLRH